MSKNLYVSPTGSDTVTYAANDITHPWLTVAKALTDANIVAGDTIYFRTGTYAWSSSINVDVDGTAGSSVTYRPYGSEVVTWSTTVPGAAMNGAINIDGHNHITFRNITFDGNDITGMIFWLGEDAVAGTDDIRFYGCTFQNWLGGDNWGAIACNWHTTNLLVDGCTIHGPGAGAHANTGGIVALPVEGLKVLRCIIHDCRIGIYFKFTSTWTNSGIEFAHNWIYDCDRWGIESEANYANIHHNILGPNAHHLKLAEGLDEGGGDYCTVDHNTFFSTAPYLCSTTVGGDLYPGAQHNTFTNNLYGARCEYHPWSSQPHNTVSDYNLFVAGAGAAVQENATNYSLAGWITHYGGDAHSIAGTPTFVGGATPSTIAGFALAPGSAGENAASDATDMGADVTLVGPAAAAVLANDGTRRYWRMRYCDANGNISAWSASGDYFDMAITATGAIALNAATVSGEGNKPITATGAIALTKPVIAGQGRAGIVGTGDVPLKSVVVAGQGQRIITGTGAIELGALTVASEGDRIITGSGIVPLGVMTVSGEGFKNNAAALRIPGAKYYWRMRFKDANGLVSSYSFSGDYFITGTGNGTIVLGKVTISGQGIRGVTGSGAIELHGITIASGTHKDITGEGAITLGDMSVSGDGTRGIPTSGAITLTRFRVLSGTGVRSSTATGAIALGDVTVAGEGVRGVTGSGAITLGDMTVSGRTVNYVTGAITLGHIAVSGLSEGLAANITVTTRIITRFTVTTRIVKRFTANAILEGERT